MTLINVKQSVYMPCKCRPANADRAATSARKAVGKPNKVICRDLRLSEGTVKVHVSAVLRALHVASRTQAVAELARRGIHADTLPRSC